MQDVTSTDEPCINCPEIDKFNPAQYSRKIFGMYGGREELVTFECREKLAGVMIDRFGMDVHFAKTDFGFRFTLRVMVSPTFLAWLLGFGSDIRILAPESVKAELISHVSQIMENYE